NLRCARSPLPPTRVSTCGYFGPTPGGIFVKLLIPFALGPEPAACRAPGGRAEQSTPLLPGGWARTMRDKACVGRAAPRRGSSREADGDRGGDLSCARRHVTAHLAGVEQAVGVDLGLEADLVGVDALVAAAVPRPPKRMNSRWCQTSSPNRSAISATLASNRSCGNRHC